MPFARYLGVRGGKVTFLPYRSRFERPASRTADRDFTGPDADDHHD